MPDALPPVAEDWSTDTLVLRCSYTNDRSCLFVTMGFEWYNGILIEIDAITDEEGNDLESSLPYPVYHLICNHVIVSFRVFDFVNQFLSERPELRPRRPDDSDDAVKNWKMDRAEQEEP